MQSTLAVPNSFTVQSEQLAGLHVAIIMDGNGRWAARRNLPRVAGHRAGVAAVRRIVEHAPDVGIRCLTVYAFSSDNWRRPPAEVRSIFWLLRAFLRLERERLSQAGARLEVIGRRDRITGVAAARDRPGDLCHRRRPEPSSAGGHRLLFARRHHARCQRPSTNIRLRAAARNGQSGVERREWRGGLAYPHRRREAPLRLPAVGVRLRRALVYRSNVAGVRDQRSGCCTQRLQREGAPLWRGSRVSGSFSRRWCAMIAPGSRPLNVKFILPSLKEASDPYWRPIKYALFPPLGLATLAAYLSADDRAVIVDEHVETLTLDDAPELVVIQVYITNAYRAYKIADHYRSRGAFVCLGGLHVTSLPKEATVHADAIFLGPGEQTFRKIFAGLSCRQGGAGLHVNDRPHAGARSGDPPRSHPARVVPGAELHCGDARVPATLRLLLQGCLFSGRP